jgi:hypothetical protein
MTVLCAALKDIIRTPENAAAAFVTRHITVLCPVSGTLMLRIPRSQADADATSYVVNAPLQLDFSEFITPSAPIRSDLLGVESLSMSCHLYLSAAVFLSGSLAAGANACKRNIDMLYTCSSVIVSSYTMSTPLLVSLPVPITIVNLFW